MRAPGQPIVSVTPQPAVTPRPVSQQRLGGGGHLGTPRTATRIRTPLRSIHDADSSVAGSNMRFDTMVTPGKQDGAGALHMTAALVPFGEEDSIYSRSNPRQEQFSHSRIVEKAPLPAEFEDYPNWVFVFGFNSECPEDVILRSDIC